MRVILTHEMADFDAIASQLGAWLLDRASVPVLPDRVNRNVRAYLTLYGAELPFRERDDLASGPIESAVLVDTQSMRSLKGMRRELNVQVVDHHALRGDLPASWQTRIEPVGATATLFVEALQERRIPLTQIEATLLLLGIYEDTGSLTYTRTTPRDLLAGAALLDQGASLQIVGDFLNHPLSLAQQAILDAVKDSLQTLEIGGNIILVGSADAEDTHEELSTIAHKLRDELDPDALVLLFRISGGVQLIARATTDRVNAGDIAAAFGGGGHNRAAAAMIKKGQLETVHQQLLAYLPEHIQPVLTVAEIMSRGGPQTLAAETPVQEAQARMQRYGYEGYPVVEAGRVIGLATRRAIDRAVSHRLDSRARDVMEAGEVTISAAATIEALQSLMTETGWGQVPVVDAAGEIIGIVTRTDLLRTLSPQAPIPGRRRIDDRLEEALPAAHVKLLRSIAEEADRAQVALYIVGGFVRDLLLGRPSLDFDLVVEGDAIALARAVVTAHGGRVTAHRRFGTAKWHLDGLDFGLESIDLVTARTEFYTHPTALPTVERGSIKLDLHRRDFTLNTLAVRLDGSHFGELHDYWGGVSDLRQKLIRVLHSLSFVDDPTRMLRAVRFEQRFGFSIEPRTLELLKAALGLLDRVSGDRIRHELENIFTEPAAEAMFSRLDELGLLEAIHPELGGVHRPEMFTCDLPGEAWELESGHRGLQLDRALPYLHWWIRTSPAHARGFSRRLKLKQALEAVILDAIRLLKDAPGLQDAPASEITRRLDESDRLAVFAVRGELEDEPLAAAFDQYAASWRHIKPQTDGRTLAEHGLAPGPAYREILGALRDAWLDGRVNSATEEARLLGELLEQTG